MHSERQSR